MGILRKLNPTKALLLTPLVVGLAACDFSVTNPGPVEDESLNDVDAVAGLVVGVQRELAQALDNSSYVIGAVTREIHPAGSTGTYGITVKEQQGIIDPGENSTSGYWDRGQQARWTAEDAIRRITEVLGTGASSSPLIAQARIYAGFANRMLGETFCEAVIDGGSLEPSSVFLTRAEQHFKTAITVAQAAGNADMAMTARAGLAQVQADLGKWSEAAATAKQVPTSFEYAMPYYASESGMYNEIYESSAGTFRAHTVWNTYYDDYATASGDPRVGWVADPKQPTGDAGVLHLGRVPWHKQTKYTFRDSSIDLADGAEMRLIEAEAALRNGDWTTALSMVNALRTANGVAPRTATGVNSTWQVLLRERGIELWLEGRRLYDVRRWLESGMDPTLLLDPLETATGVRSASHLEVQATCIPVGRSERETNPNVPLS